jgi:DNA-binding NarL/FixJ family response regulator
MNDGTGAAIRVLLAHRNAIFREGVRATLATLSAAGNIEEAADGEQALETATATAPNVVICGAALPDMSGMQLMRALRLRVPNAGVILLADREAPDTTYQALKAGASGYIMEDASPAELRELVERVVRGEHTIDETLLNRPDMASKVLEDFSMMNDATPQELQPLLAPLSTREIEILDQISRGNSNKQIGHNLAISDQTVKNHITSILKKLAVNDRTEAVVFSLRRGWITIDGRD